MGDQRDPERDQPLPKPGQVNVQRVLSAVVLEREAYGKRKYGTPLQTHNGRDALRDAWEEALDLVTYLTQMRLERGDVLPGMDPPAEFPKPFELTVTFPQRFTTSDLPHGVEGCTCRPWTRQGGEARFLEPGESVALVSGWERHPDCPNHRPEVLREGDPSLNDLQDYLEGDRATAEAAAKRLDQRAVTEGQLAPMTYHARWGELPDLKGRP